MSSDFLAPNDKSTYISHRRDDGTEQSVYEHLCGTAALAQNFASAFGAENLAKAAALIHDIGKYSAEFQRRIRGKNIRVDHSTAGARELVNNQNNIPGLLAAYCVAGHHTGLPDGGSKDNPTGEGSLYYRLQLGELPPYAAFKNEIRLPNIEPPQGFTPSDKDTGFSLSFLTRMLFSALVDADWLDTEAFMQNGAVLRGGFDDISLLHKKLIFHISRFENPSRPIDYKRNELLSACLTAAELSKGLFTLTAPTGSGKTVASMSFALKHAEKNQMQRVIYVIPYCSIIEQNAKIFEEILGSNNVIQHHSNIDYDGKNNDNENDPKRFAIENWDAPVIVTTNVQFFESLFANKKSKCRKLHNIANSVIVFDEAQMLPLPYLLPCVAAIKELVTNYHCTAVLATATQSSLDEFFSPLPLTEINPDPVGMYTFFRRVRFMQEPEPFSTEQLAERLNTQDEVLCIVNTRKRAQELAILVDEAVHLSTTMYPEHRRRVLDDVRGRLRQGKPCRVISTSLIEAGVDVDFPALYREKAGLDSIIQAAGRCNREGKRNTDDSLVTVFHFDDSKPPAEIQRNIAAYEYAARQYAEIDSLKAIQCYFNQLHYIIGNDGLDKNNAVSAFNDGIKAAMSFPFKTVAESFRVIDDTTKTLIIDCPESAELCKRLRFGERSKALLRAIQKYSVSVYPNDYRILSESGCIECLDESLSILSAFFYNKKLGVEINAQTGKAIII